jgi:predicted permease
MTSRLRSLKAAIAGLFARTLESEIDQDLQFHVDELAENNLRAGMSRDEARRQALIALGGIEQTKEECRDALGIRLLRDLAQDLHFGFRQLRRTPTFTVVALLSLAVGIGASTAVFSLMDAMLLRSLPVKNPQELVEFVRAHPDGAKMENLPYPVFKYFRHEGSVLSDVFAVSRSSPTFRAGGMSESVKMDKVSGSFFPCLGVQALLGRTIGPGDDRVGATNHVAVVSYAFWSRQFGGDPSALGASVRLSGEPFTIIGVMPPEFFGVDRGTVPDLWAPLSVDPDPIEVWVLGRLRPGISVARARAQLEPVFQRALESLRDGIRLWSERERNAFFAQRLLVSRAAEGTAGVRWTYWDYSGTLKILIGLTCLVLLIACANLANLLMARYAARSREIGMRIALGAGRQRLVRQLLTENLLLALAGGALAIPVAAWGHRLTLGFLVRDPLAVALDFRLDARLLGFGLASSLATVLLFGLMPGIRATRADRSGAMYGAGRQRGPLNMPIAKGLLAVQIGLSIALLIGAGLFARSLGNLGTADLGFARENLLLMDVRPGGKTPQAWQQFWVELSRRMSGLPGIRSVALAGDAIFGTGDWKKTVWIERAGQPAQVAKVSDNLVSPGYFATAGIPILAGREFGDQDRENAPPVAVVNQTFANRFFADENPIGKRFGDRGQASSGRYEIVGVLGDTKYGTIREQTRPMVFHPMGQEPPRASCVVHVRTASEPAALVPSIRREIQAIDGEALISNVRTLPQVIRAQLRQDRMFATLASFFGLFALALGAIGVYGIVAFRVTQRTAEIGVRMALGARRIDVLWLIMRETLLLLAGGTVIGLSAALAAGRLIRSFLFGLSPWDPLTITCAIFILLAAGALAGFLPARRAASAEPTTALRND